MNSEAVKVEAERDAAMEVLRELVAVDDWVIQAGGMDGPLSGDVIQKFAEMRLPLMDRARSLVDAAMEQGVNNGD